MIFILEKAFFDLFPPLPFPPNPLNPQCLSSVGFQEPLSEMLNPVYLEISSLLENGELPPELLQA